jgi:hypothetical protein
MRFIPLALILLSPTAAFGQQAGTAVRYILADAVPRLPPIVRADLVARECVVPAGRSDSTISAIEGEFQEAGRRDWAILCVAGKEARILFFPRNEGSATDSFPSRGDRLLRIAEPAYVIRHLMRNSEDVTLARKSDSLKVAISHDGIEEVNPDGGSMIYFWQGGKWQQYPGERKD